MKTLSAYCTLEEEVKKSRFICHALPIENREEAMAFLEDIQDPSARHNCWAYKVGQDYRFSDDGEPSGTAGKRILAAIEQNDLDGVMVVVVRWFGGIKLGVGGLSRAYGGSASRCLQAAACHEVIVRRRVFLKLPFSFYGQLNSLLQRFSASKVNEDCTQEGMSLTVEMPAVNIEDFLQDLQDLSRGQAKVQLID